MDTFVYEFEWDPVKDRVNRNRHGVRFEQATQIFRDPLALTIADEEHSEEETRWITLGRDLIGRYLLVVHTFKLAGDKIGRVRLISARTPTRAEIRSYEEER